MFPGQPNSSEIICNSVTATGTLVTIPAGKWFTGELSLTGATSVAGNCFPTVTTSGTGVAPASGTVVGRLHLTGVALLGPVSSSNTTEVIVLSPIGNSVTLEFTAGAVGTSSATINGYIFG